MSHSGNNNYSRLRQVPPPVPGAKASIVGEQLYNPSVFRYKCIGYLNLNSDQKGSPGVCRGLQSRMERVANMVPDTREAAIKKFLDASSDLGTYVDAADAADETADQKVKEIYTSRTMIYKDDEEKNQPPAADNNANKVAKIQRAHKSTAIPEEDLIDKTEWSCYGSTQVHYLVLDPIVQTVKVEKRTNRGKSRSDLPPEFAEMEKRADRMFDDVMKRFGGKFERPGSGSSKSGEERSETATEVNSTAGGDQHDAENQNFSSTTVVTRVVTSSSSSSDGGKITAITPENIGLSVRKIDSEVGHFTVADIGSIRICMETSNSLIGDSDKKADKNSGKVQPNREMQQNLAKAETSSMRSNLTDRSSTDCTDKAQNNQQDQEEKKRTVDLKKFYNFTWKVAEKMNQNVHDVKDAVSEDFPARTFRFGSKVVGRVEKTTEQTFTYMGKLLDGFWKS